MVHHTLALSQLVEVSDGTCRQEPHLLATAYNQQAFVCVVDAQVEKQQ